MLYFKDFELCIIIGVWLFVDVLFVNYVECVFCVLGESFFVVFDVFVDDIVCI